MTDADWGVLLFPSVSHALRAETLVRRVGIACKLIPTPRQLSSDCGTALRFPWDEREKVQALLDASGLEAEAKRLPGEHRRPG